MTPSGAASADFQTLARHVAAGMGRHVRWLVDNGFTVPPEVLALMELADVWSRKGLDGSFLTVDTGLGHGAGVGPLLLTFDQAADVLGVSKSTVKRLIAAGELPSVKVGRASRVRRADLDGYVAELAPTTYNHLKEAS